MRDENKSLADGKGPFEADESQSDRLGQWMREIRQEGREEAKSAWFAPDGVLRFRMESIQRAKSVLLDGDLLVWEIGYRNGSPAEDLVPVATQGCLEAFVPLADAGASEVQAFVERWGPLGLDPWVCDVPSDRQALVRRRYAEAVEVYPRLARTAKTILSVKNRLWADEKGDEAPIDRERLRACFSESSEVAYLAQLNASHLQPRDKFTTVYLAAYWWARQARCNLSLPPWPGRFDDRRSAGVLSVRFGDWTDGDAWDREQLRWCRHGADIRLRGKCPYLEDALAKVGVWPGPGQRPSPLFSALAFQLQREVSLPQGARVCPQCGHVWTPEKGRRQDAQYCSLVCKEAHRDDRRRR